MRPTIDSLMPRRSAATAPGSKPRPVSRTNPASSAVVGLDEHVDAIDAGVAGRVDDRLADRGDEGARGVVERLVADDDRLDADVVVGSRRPRPSHRSPRAATPAAPCGSPPYSHARSSRSWRRASPAIRRGSSVRWISTSDCSTESWRWAATLARSSSRMRAAALVVEAPQQAPERRARRRSRGRRRRPRSALADAPTPPRPPVRLASEPTPAPSRTMPGDDLHEAQRPAAERRARCRTDHTTAIPIATAAAGSMIPSPGHRPIARADDEDGAGRAADGELAPPTIRAPAARRRLREGGRRGDRGDAVEHGAEPTRQRQQPDGGTHHRRLDAPTVGPPAGDAGDDAVAARAAGAARRAVRSPPHRRAARDRSSHPGRPCRGPPRRQGRTRDVPDGHRRS